MKQQIFPCYVRVKLYHREIWQRSFLSSFSQPLLITEMKEKYSFLLMYVIYLDVTWNNQLTQYKYVPQRVDSNFKKLITLLKRKMFINYKYETCEPMWSRVLNPSVSHFRATWETYESLRCPVERRRGVTVVVVMVMVVRLQMALRRYGRALFVVPPRSSNMPDSYSVTSHRIEFVLVHRGVVACRWITRLKHCRSTALKIQNGNIDRPW